MENQKSVLYLGFDAKHFKTDKPILEMPLVQIEPRPIDSIEIRRIFSEIMNFTHIIFASKNSVKIFFQFLNIFGYSLNALKESKIIAIGQITAFYLKEERITPNYIASDETQEGMIRTFAHLDLDKANVLLPRSSSTRPLLSHYLVEHGIRHQICTLYDMRKHRPYTIVDLDEVDEVVFTHALTVDAFFELYQSIPKELKLHPLGPVARERLRSLLHVKQKQQNCLKETEAVYAC